MPETLSKQPPASIDPTLTTGSTLATPELQIHFNTFEEAQTAEKKFSDGFIEGVLGEGLKVGNEIVGIEGYLDKVEATPSDNKTIANPEAIADLYLKTTDMLARNLKITTVRYVDPARGTARRGVIKSAKENFLTKLHDEAELTAGGIVGCCNDATNSFPNSGIEYRGFEIDGKDPLDAASKNADDFRPNFKIQRQMSGTFIMAYSDTRVREKIQKQDKELTRRVYLNPDTLATPDIFEQVLTAANQAGLSIQLKMLQRPPEFAEAHLRREKGKGMDGFRGDGIVVYTGETQADDVLSMIFAIAKDKPEAFIGRKTSKIPQSVAEGIAVGDEPTQMKGQSLTSHRVMILEHAANYVSKSGKTGEEARALFRRYVVDSAKANKVNPRNIAFNE